VSELFEIDVAELRPTVEELLRQQGVKRSAAPNPKHQEAAEAALVRYDALAAPRAVLRAIERDAFSQVYAGGGQNEHPAPLEKIQARAHRLALCAATMGPAISREIDALFAAHDFAVAAALDAAASLGADRAGEWLERAWADQLLAAGALDADQRVLGYSPGYCGWHVSAQRKLFAALEPGRIGITLRESCLMEPMKSISGVLVAAPRAVHVVYNEYPFCEQCQTRSCLKRTKQLKRETSQRQGA